MQGKKSLFNFIKKFYLEILIIISSIVLISLVENKYAINKQIKIFTKHDITDKKIPDDTYFCKEKTKVLNVIEETYKKSKIISFKEYKNEFLKINSNHIKNSYCIPNSYLKIPKYKSNITVNQPLKWNRSAKGIYIRWDNASIDNIIKILDNAKGTNLNALVIDAKDIVGILTYKSNDPIVQKYQNNPPIIKDFPKLIEYLHNRNIYVIMRVALFQDMNLVKHRKDLAIYNPNTASKTIEYKGHPIWVDPAKEEVQDYNLRIVHELVSYGVDEIQFDYIRYPAEGNLNGVVYYKVKHPEDKIQHLKNFLFKAWMILYPTDVKLSIDTFGITAWQERKDIEATGQKIPEISIFLDYISPMLYPSHFGLFFEGYHNPADYPEYFYKKGILLLKNLIPEYVKIRPWIQAFKWRVTNFNENYILRQISTIESIDDYGWLLWNAANEYELAFRVMRIQ